jgi:hypothetical protein
MDGTLKEYTAVADQVNDRLSVVRHSPIVAFVPNIVGSVQERPSKKLRRTGPDDAASHLDSSRGNESWPLIAVWIFTGTAFREQDFISGSSFSRYPKRVTEILLREKLFMATTVKVRFSGPTRIFHERTLPELATPAGYAALIDAYRLAVPLPRTLSATGELHRTREASGWRILTPRPTPPSTLAGHLTFALKNEGLDLARSEKAFPRRRWTRR